MKCNSQNKLCREQLALNWKDIQGNPRYCAYMDKKIKVSYYDARFTGHATEALYEIIQSTKMARPLIVVEVGIYNHFKAENVWKG